MSVLKLTATASVRSAVSMTRRAPKRAVMAPANGPHTPWLYFCPRAGPWISGNASAVSATQTVGVSIGRRATGDGRLERPARACHRLTGTNRLAARRAHRHQSKRVAARTVLEHHGAPPGSAT